jgi:hypothetical protein
MFAEGMHNMEMALGRQRVLVFKLIDQSERPVKGADVERAYARRQLRRQLEQERFEHQNMAWKTMAWWNGLY